MTIKTPRLVVEHVVLAEPLFRRLEQLQKDLARRDLMLEQIGHALENSVHARFRSMTDPSGKRWKALSARYLRAKKNNDKILTLEGRLNDQIVHQIQGDTVTVGTNVPYAAIHQFGGTVAIGEQTVTRKRGTKGKNKGRFMVGTTKAKHAVVSTFKIPAHKVRIPARPFLGLSEADRVEVRETIKDHIRRALEGA